MSYKVCALEMQQEDIGEVVYDQGMPLVCIRGIETFHDNDIQMCESNLGFNLYEVMEEFIEDICSTVEVFRKQNSIKKCSKGFKVLKGFSVMDKTIAKIIGKFSCLVYGTLALSLLDRGLIGGEYIETVIGSNILVEFVLNKLVYGIENGHIQLKCKKEEIIPLIVSIFEMYYNKNITMEG